MELLDEAIATLGGRGVLTPLADLIRQVYRRAADRHEPDLGDDAMSFGTTVWRNLTNLGAAQFVDLPGVEARVEDNSLEILCAGYVVRLYSLHGMDTNVESIRWEGSDARLGGAVANSQHRQLALDEGSDTVPIFAGVVPRKRHIRIAHAGDLATGEALAFIGLPRDNREGGSPWFEVELWFGQPPATHASTPHAGTGAIASFHDELPIPELDVQLRRQHRIAAVGDKTPA